VVGSNDIFFVARFAGEGGGESEREREKASLILITQDSPFRIKLVFLPLAAGAIANAPF
jgi:hypothetical protein